MPHVNHRRGETRRFVYRREHAKLTHYTWHKGKSDSWKPWKKEYNRLWRSRQKQALHDNPEDPVPRSHKPLLLWILT